MCEQRMLCSMLTEIKSEIEFTVISSPSEKWFLNIEISACSKAIRFHLIYLRVCDSSLRIQTARNGSHKFGFERQCSSFGCAELNANRIGKNERPNLRTYESAHAGYCKK